MKLSNRTDYALRALIEISLHYDEGGLISAKEISKREGIPIKYLEQILLALKLAGFVGSHQGINGGYTLTRPPEQITFGEVIRTIEGSVTSLDCAENKADQSITKSWHQGFQNVMVRLKNAITDVVDNTTLADISRLQSR